MGAHYEVNGKLKPLILKDDREKTGWEFPEDGTFAGTKVQRVLYGDYTIEGHEDIFLERKNSTGEIAYNMINERFWNLMENAKHLKYKFIIIEADYQDILNYPLNSQLKPTVWNPTRKRYVTNVATKIKPAFLIECMSRLAVEYGMSVIFAGSATAAEKAAHSLLKEILKHG